MASKTGIENLVESLQNSVASGGSMDGALVHLFTNTPTITRTNALFDFTEAVYSGYGAIGPIWTTVVNTGGDQPAFSTTGPMTFGVNGSGSPVVIQGYYITDAGNTEYKGAEYFPGGPLTLPPGLGFNLEVIWEGVSEF